MFYERYVFLCEGRGLTPSAGATKAGFNRGTVSVWKKKYEAKQDVVPEQNIIDKICAFFGCSESWLRGIEKDVYKRQDEILNFQIPLIVLFQPGSSNSPDPGRQGEVSIIDIKGVKKLRQIPISPFIPLHDIMAVSYTHLDVYKRQTVTRAREAPEATTQPGQAQYTTGRPP